MQMSQAKAAYSRILVKLSGEALMGDGDYGIDPVVIKRIAGELQEIVEMRVQLAVVIAMQDALESLGLHARVMSAIRINEVCEDYIRRRAVRHLEKGRVTIFAAGTGNPFFTTDTAAALRAIEINADVLLKATKVNGVFSDDPLRNPQALRYAHLTFDKVLADRLNVMDATAIVMCRDNRLPLRVFNLNNPGDLTRIVRGEDVGTAVTFD
jgi:uridylate kinase